MVESISVEKRKFVHNKIEYLHAWVRDRHFNPLINQEFGLKLLNYYDFICSSEYPDEIFNRRDGIRCSGFRIKGLQTNARKKISLELISRRQIQLIDSNNHPMNVSPGILKLPEMASIWFDIYSSILGKNPGHAPVLDKILQINQNALAIETPVWTTTSSALNKELLHTSQYTCMANEIFTGHIDLTLFDETDGSLIITDYKPENKFLTSLPQVATYGLVMKQILGFKKVKCVSFSKEQAWLYDPEIIRTIIPHYLVKYGNPDLIWRGIVPTL
ncbi:MAG: hypothetical protein ACTSXK_13740 [Promethearchaeota archaeon]